MSLTSYRAAPPRATLERPCGPGGGRRGGRSGRARGGALVRPGGDRLSRVFRRSTMGGCALNGRVRDGIGCVAQPMAARPDQGPPPWAVPPGAAGRARSHQTSRRPAAGQGPSATRQPFQSSPRPGLWRPGRGGCLPSGGMCVLPVRAGAGPLRARSGPARHRVGSSQSDD